MVEHDDFDLPIVDAHHHLWDLDIGVYPSLNCGVTLPYRYGDYSAIQRNYLYEDYRRDSAKHNIIKSVHMEAEWAPADPVAETRWVSGYAETHDLTNALVGRAWLDRDDVEEVLAGHAAFDLTRSIRQKPAAADAPADFVPGAQGSMADAKFRDGYALLNDHGLFFDLQTPWWHLGEAADLAGKFPDTQIILNHTGLPSDRSDRGLAGWRDAMQGLAQAPNVAVKISGIGVPGEAWTTDLNRGVVLDTIEAFGVDRCMFASNFPFDSLCATFDQIFSSYKEITRDFSAQDRTKLFHDNAVRFYRL